MADPISIPGAELVGPVDSPAAAPPQIPGAEYVGPAAAPSNIPTDADLAKAANSPMAKALAQADAVNAKGLSPLAQASNQWQLQHPVNYGPQTGAVQNAGAAAFHAVGDPLGNAGLRLGNRMGIVSDQSLQNAVANPLFQPDMSRTSGVVGAGVGQAGEALALGAYAPAAFATQAGENEREALDARQAGGEQISPLRQAGDVGGQAALAYALGKFAPGGSATKAITGAAGKIADPLLNAGRNIAVGAGAGTTENVAQQIGGNAIRKYIGGNKNQEVTEGVEDAAKQGLVFGGVGQAVHEAPHFLAGMRERAAAKESTPPAAPQATIPAPEGSKVEPAAKTPEKGQPEQQEAKPTPIYRNGGKGRYYSESQDYANGFKGEPQETTLDPTLKMFKGNIYDIANPEEKIALNQYRSSHAETTKIADAILRRNGYAGHSYAEETANGGAATTHSFLPEHAPNTTHPTRLENGEKLAEWYKSQNPKDHSGDLIGTMAGHVPYAMADVPHEFAQPLTDNGGQDVDQNKIESLANLSDADHAKLPPAILGPNGEVFDGNHRALAASLADRPLRAYVPESLIGQHGIEAAGGEQKPQANATRLYGGKRAGAVALPSREDVTGPGSIYHEEIRPQLEKLNKVGKEVFGGLKQLFPVETGAGHEDAQQAFREQFNRNANDHYAAEDAFESARKGFDKMHPEDRMAFQRAMYNKESQPTPELQKVADSMYADTNEGRLALESLGHQAAADWDQQKWNMLWKKDPKAAADMLGNSGNPNRPGRIEGKAGFLKTKKLAEFDEGLQRGLVPKHDNPVDMFLATKAERGKYIAGVKGMEQLVRNEQIVRAETDENGHPVIPQGWSEVPGSAKGPLKNVLAGKYPDQLGGETPLIAPDGVNRILKNITTPSALGNKAAFRFLMDANNTMTQSLLGLSGFHIKKVSQELINLSAARALDMGIAGEHANAGKTAVQSITSPFKAVMSGGEIQKMMLGQMQPQTAQQARVIDAMKTQFKARPDREYETQWGRKFQKALNDGGLQGMIRASAHALPALNERLMQKGVFAFVQRAKLHMGSELVTDYLRKNPNASHEELVKETGKISDHLDNVLGLMNRDNLFWDRTARDLATLGTLSVGWNYGSARALGGGIVDLGKGLGSLAKGGKLADIDTRRISYLATTAALTALTGAAVTYMATGQRPQSLRDLVFPPSGGKDRDGHDIRLNTGFYTSDYFDFMHDPIGTLKAKGSPLMHAASDLMTNRDYKGDKVFDKDEPWYKMAGQIAKYLGESATPLSMQQLAEVIQGGGAGKGIGMKMAGFAGVKTAPRNLSMSDAENAAHQIMQGKESVAGRSAREAELSGVKGKLADEVRDKNPDAQKDIQAAVKAGTITGKDAKGVFKRASEPQGLKGLLKSSELDPRDIMEKVWPKMTAQERQDNQWMIRGRIGRANLTPAERQKFWAQIKQDVQGVK